MRVEKVVNPPRKPAKMKDLSSGETFLNSNNPHNRPIAKAPTILTINVPRGKNPSYILSEIYDTK
jgi:hypothetical protein